MAISLYTRYTSAKTNAPDANYPLGSARNVTVSGDGLGTPWEKDWVNDVDGFKQALLANAGVSVNNLPDTALVSQQYNAMRLTSGHPGLITPLALNVTPASLGLRVLLLDGSGVAVSSYDDLVTYTYVGDSANPTAGAFYRADDAAGTIRNTSGAYLILPDARGRFPRGLDAAATIDPDGATRELGDNQDDAVQRHNHVIKKDPPGVVTQGYNSASLLQGTGDLFFPFASQSAADSEIEASALKIGEDIDAGYTRITGVGRVSTETRPANFAVNWGVWY